mgnify:CR=1 FL=1
MVAVVDRMFGSLIIGVVVVDKQVVVVKIEIVIGKLMAVVAVAIVDTNYSVQQEPDCCYCY